MVYSYNQFRVALLRLRKLTDESKNPISTHQGVRAKYELRELLTALRLLHDDGKIREEQMIDGNFKWLKK